MKKIKFWAIGLLKAIIVICSSIAILSMGMISMLLDYYFYCQEKLSKSNDNFQWK